MRFDTLVYFVKELPSFYDPETGDYDTSGPEETLAYASVSDASEMTMNLVYGKIKQGAKVIRIQGSINSAFDYIRIGTTKYRVDRKLTLRRLEAYTVSEIQKVVSV